MYLIIYITIYSLLTVAYTSADSDNKGNNNKGKSEHFKGALNNIRYL